MDLCIGFAQIRAILFHKQLKSRGLYSLLERIISVFLQPYKGGYI